MTEIFSLIVKILFVLYFVIIYTYLFHLMYIMKVWLQFWMSQISPLAMEDCDSYQTARLYAQQLSKNKLWVNQWTFHVVLATEKQTFSLSVIWKLWRLMFRCRNCVPTTALDNWWLVWLVVIIRWWPRWWCDSSVSNFPSRRCWRFELNRFKFPFNVWRLWCWFRCPNWSRWWIGRLLDV